MTITPDIAKKWILKNESNRRISSSVVDFIAKEINEGRWIYNGESIKFGQSGYLIDGQHRLYGVLKANKPIISLVSFGIQDCAFDRIDIGKKRSSADVLSIRGVKNSSYVASTLALLVRYYNGESMMSRVKNTTASHILEDLVKYPEVLSCVEFANRLYKNVGSHKIMSITHYGFLYCILSKKNKELALDFLSRLASGENIAKGEPVYWLRQRLDMNLISKAKLPSGYVIAISIKAWNATRLNKNLKTLRFSEYEDFPVPI
jgi:hypothetical protein